MHRVVLDTNIFVSSIFWKKGNPHKVVMLSLEGKVNVFTSLPVLEELTKVLRRDFEEPEELVQRQVGLILKYAKVIRPKMKLKVIREDPADDKILECAVSCKADYIISGDHHLLKCKEYKRTKIVSAKEFLEQWNK